MSGYLAQLLARAAAPGDFAPSAAEGVLRPERTIRHEGPDPFETTIDDPPEWPATAPARTAVMPPAPAATAVSPITEPAAPPQRSVVLTPAAAASPLAPRTNSAPEASEPSTPALADETPIEQTLRPWSDNAPRPLQPSEPRVSPLSPPHTPADSFTIADRFMEGVLPAHWLQPEVRVETTREIVRDLDETRVFEAVPGPPILQPAIVPDDPAPEDIAGGLVIGSLHVTVVPPAPAPVTATRAPVPAPSVAVVRQSGTSARGVPSFSRFG